jgi:hypothetical protein
MLFRAKDKWTLEEIMPYVEWVILLRFKKYIDSPFICHQLRLCYYSVMIELMCKAGLCETSVELGWIRTVVWNCSHSLGTLMVEWKPAVEMPAAVSICVLQSFYEIYCYCNSNLIWLSALEFVLASGLWKSFEVQIEVWAWANNNLHDELADINCLSVHGVVNRFRTKLMRSWVKMLLDQHFFWCLSDYFLHIKPVVCLM